MGFIKYLAWAYFLIWLIDSLLLFYYIISLETYALQYFFLFDCSFGDINELWFDDIKSAQYMRFMKKNQNKILNIRPLKKSNKWNETNSVFHSKYFLSSMNLIDALIKWWYFTYHFVLLLSQWILEIIWESYFIGDEIINWLCFRKLKCMSFMFLLSICNMTLFCSN